MWSKFHACQSRIPEKRERERLTESDLRKAGHDGILANEGRFVPILWITFQFDRVCSSPDGWNKETLVPIPLFLKRSGSKLEKERGGSDQENRTLGVCFPWIGLKGDFPFHYSYPLSQVWERERETERIRKWLGWWLRYREWLVGLILNWSWLATLSNLGKPIIKAKIYCIKRRIEKRGTKERVECAKLTLFYCYLCIVAVLVLVFHLMKLLLLELFQREEGDGRKEEDGEDDGASCWCSLWWPIPDAPDADDGDDAVGRILRPESGWREFGPLGFKCRKREALNE